MSMNKLMQNARGFYFLILVTCSLLLGFGYYLEFYQALTPCPLCVFQRVAYMVVGGICLLGFVHRPQHIGKKIYSGLAFIAAITGAGIAARQVWLQHLPPELVPECGPDLSFMLAVLPLSETIKLVFSGSGECAEVAWSFLSLSIAQWSLLWFSVLSILFIIHFFKSQPIKD